MKDISRSPVVSIPKKHPKVNYLGAIPFVVIHLLCFAVLWTGVTTVSLTLCFSLYFIRMWAITAGYHRYFSHKSFKTSRVFQFILAFLAQSSLQRGVLQWANDHRRHHAYSDTYEDTHSPRMHGFLYSHVGWVFAENNYDTDYSRVEDLKKFPDIVWLNKHKYLPGVLLGILTWFVGGWSGLIVGFFISTVMLYHTTFFINSIAHVIGRQRYLTADDSRNNWWLALMTLGEGWHNNHHHYPASVRQGFFWWELDITYYVLKILSWCGVVWDLKVPPQEIVQTTANISPRLITQAKRLFANVGFDLKPIVAKLEAVKNEIAVQHNQTAEKFYADLNTVRDMLEMKLTLINTLPQKLAQVVKFNMEESMVLLQTLIAHKTNQLNVASQQIITTVDNILGTLTFQKRVWI